MMFWVHTYFFIIILQVRARVAERSKLHSFHLLQWQMEVTAISQANRSKGVGLAADNSLGQKEASRTQEPLISLRSVT